MGKQGKDRITSREEEQAFIEEQSKRNEKKGTAIIGEPGAGKTTTLQDIGRKIFGEKIEFPEQQQTQDVAIWVSFAEIQERSLDEYLRQDWLMKTLGERRVIPQQQDELVELFESGRVWLLLDGFDEMVSDNPLQALLSQLQGWVGSANVMLTCRASVWLEKSSYPLANFTTYRLQEIDYPQQTHKFIDKFFEFCDPAKGDSLKLELDIEVWLQNLMSNPLCLAMLCRIWLDREEKLPENRAELYREYVQLFYNWNKRRLTLTAEEREELYLALGNLAKEAIIGEIEQGSSRFRLPESLVYKILGDPESEDSLFHRASKLGWLNCVGNAKSKPTEKVYAFFHPTFEEYFAALAIDRWHFFLYHVPSNPNHRKVSYRIFEPQWKEVILLWLRREDVQLEQKEELIQALVEFDSRCGKFYARRAYLLAAEGIAEFKNCSRADEIVEQMVKWCLDHHYYIKEELWAIFAVFLKTERTRAINGLTQLIDDKSQNEYIRLLAAGNLGRIDKGNIKAINALVTIIKNSQDEFYPWQAIDILGEIAQGNQAAIDALFATLVDLMQNSPKSENVCWVTHSLVIVAKSNKKLIKDLELLINKPQSEDIQFYAASSLGRIDKGNPIAKNTLVKIIREFRNDYMPCNAANVLEEIAKNDSTTIYDLVQLVQESQFKETLELVVRILGRIAKGNPTAIKALVDLLHDSQPESIRWRAASALMEIDPDNPKAIDTLVGLIQNLQYESTDTPVVSDLWFIESNNPKLIDALVELIQNYPSEYIRRQAASSLGQSGLDNPKVIEVLAESLQNTRDEYFIWLIGRIFRETGDRYPTIIQALESLTQDSHQPEVIRVRATEGLVAIGASNPKIIEALESIVKNSQSEESKIEAAQKLLAIEPGNSIAINILKLSAQNRPSKDVQRDSVVRSLSILERDQMEEVVTELKDRILDRPTKNNFREYRHWYQIIWQCAQTLTYPEFYQAWHPSPHTPHPEVTETSAELPELLRSAVNKDLYLKSEVQLICINGSNFIDCDNPTLKIYREMHSQGCPNYSDGKPKTIAQLQDYWDELKQDSDRTLVLVFYENPIAPPQGFSEAFLNALSRFDGAICVISNQPDIPLQSFCPNQPNLVVNVIGWIGKILLENP